MGARSWPSEHRRPQTSEGTDGTEGQGGEGGCCEGEVSCCDDSHCESVLSAGVLSSATVAPTANNNRKEMPSTYYSQEQQHQLALATGTTQLPPYTTYYTPVGATAQHQLSQDERLRREAGQLRDNYIRTRSVQTDLALNLPPSIALSDGEEHPYSSLTQLQLRTEDQYSELRSACIKPPPNRTVFEGESPPPYRSTSSLGLNNRSQSKTDCFKKCLPARTVIQPGHRSGSKDSRSSSNSSLKGDF